MAQVPKEIKPQDRVMIYTEDGWKPGTVVWCPGNGRDDWGVREDGYRQSSICSFAHYIRPMSETGQEVYKETSEKACALMRRIRSLFIGMNLPANQRDAKVQTIFENLLTRLELAEEACRDAHALLQGTTEMEDKTESLNYLTPFALILPLEESLGEWEREKTAQMIEATE
jgi:hypothetical protein